MRIITRLFGVLVLCTGVVHTVFAIQIANQEYLRIVSVNIFFYDIIILGRPVTQIQALLVFSIAGLVLCVLGWFMVVASPHVD